MTNSFYGLGIAPKILETLDRMKFTTPTPIQQKAIPIGAEGKDVIGIAQTGTGKTLAFAIPVIQRLAQGRGRCLILVPTRELAMQVDETFQKLVGIFGLRTAVIIGGASMHLQLQALRRNPRIIIATPGRLVDHLEQRNVMLMDVSIFILDEADRMLDMGFGPQIERVMKCIPKERQTMLFSATMPPEILKMATAQMKLPVHVEIAPAGTTLDSIIQELYIVHRDKKKDLLVALLKEYKGSVLLFTRTKIGASKITRALRSQGHSAAEIHSDRTLGQRKEALDGFKSGRYRILVATDIAARGIDVKGIELVINFDLPEDADNYVHRIGRTGRAGLEGRAISIATPDQGEDVKSIERLIKTALPISERPDFPKEKFIHNAPPRTPGYKGHSRSSYGGGRDRQGGGYGGQRTHQRRDSVHGGYSQGGYGGNRERQPRAEGQGQSQSYSGYSQGGYASQSRSGFGQGERPANGPRKSFGHSKYRARNFGSSPKRNVNPPLI